MVKNSDIASIIDISLFKTKYPQSISLPQQHPIRKLPILGYPLLDGRQSAPV